jgi:DNA-directed RNA polymerase specialized sigma24 family protein
MVGAAEMAVDDQVVERSIAGDAEAWRSLVGAHLPLVRAICTGYGLDEAASAEVNQVVWLCLAEHLSRIRTPAAIGGWVASTTRSECLRPQRSSARSGWVTAALAGSSGGTPASSDDVVAVAFGRLGAQCQRLLRLVLAEPCPTDDQVCAALDVAADEIDASCARCLERLTRMLTASAPDDRPVGDRPDAVREELRQLIVASSAVPATWWEPPALGFAWLQLAAPAARRVYEVVGARRELRYSAGPAGIDLEIEASDDELLLVGRLRPAQAATGLAKVTVRWPDGTQSTGTDDEGTFRLDRLPRAPLCVHVGGSQPFKTGWIV